MPKSETFTICWIETVEEGNPGERTFLASEMFYDVASVEARCIAFARDSVDYVVSGGPVLPVTVDTSPRVTIGDAAPVADKPKKPRAKRRTREQIEADAIAAAAKKAGGKVGGVEAKP